MPNKKKQQGQGKPKAKPKHSGPNDLITISDSGWGGVPKGVPQAHKAILTYGTYITFAPATNSVGAQSYSGNSVFDPDNTGVGSQPYWYDQWSAIYGRYRVVKCRIETRIVNNGTVPCDVVVVPTVGVQTETDIYDISEWKYAQRRTVVAPTGGPSVATIVSTMRTNTVFGIQKQAALIEDAYASDYSTNPPAAYRWYWMVFCQTAGGLATTPSIIVEVRLHYYVVFFEPRYNGDSVTVTVRPRDDGPRARRVPSTVVGSGTLLCETPPAASHQLSSHVVRGSPSLESSDVSSRHIGVRNLCSSCVACAGAHSQSVPPL